MHFAVFADDERSDPRDVWGRHARTDAPVVRVGSAGAEDEVEDVTWPGYTGDRAITCNGRRVIAAGTGKINH